jgi:drug/metabolite transporter (DMT)-like permease
MRGFNLLNMKPAVYGSLFALITVLIWGGGVVGTKVLLTVTDLNALEILFFRTLIGYTTLFILHPKFYKTGIKDELLFLACGLTGITLCQFAQNMALVYSTAANVGLLVYSSPIVTAGFIYLFDKNEKIGLAYIIGFILAMSGIYLIIFNGTFVLDLNPLGDILALVACVLWGLYCVIIKKVTAKDYNVLYSTRKILFYGLLTTEPFTFFIDFSFDLTPFLNKTALISILFIGIGGYAIAYATWSKATQVLGAAKASPYLYLTPVVTVIVSFFVLGETITPAIVSGGFLILVGLYISEMKSLMEVKIIFMRAIEYVEGAWRAL